MFTFKFRVDGAGFKRGLDKMRGELDEFTKSTAGMMGGFLIGGGVLASLDMLKNRLLDINAVAKRFGTTVETIQRLEHVVKKSRMGIDNLADAMGTANEKAQEAMMGSKSMQEGFEMMNLSASEFISMSLDEQVEAIAKGYEHAKKNGNEWFAMNEVLGGQANELLPFFAQGWDEINKQMEEAGVHTSKVVMHTARLNSMWEDMKSRAIPIVSDFLYKLFQMRHYAKAVGDTIGESIATTIFNLIEPVNTLYQALKKIADLDFKGAFKEMWAGSERVLERNKALVTGTKERFSQAGDDMFAEDAIARGEPNRVKRESEAARARKAQAMRDKQVAWYDTPEQADKDAKGRENVAKERERLIKERQKLIAADKRANVSAFKKTLGDAIRKQRGKVSEAERAQSSAEYEEESIRAEKPRGNVIASELAKAGGGGRAVVGLDHDKLRQDKANRFLAIIAQNTSAKANLRTEQEKLNVLKQHEQ